MLKSRCSCGSRWQKNNRAGGMNEQGGGRASSVGRRADSVNKKTDEMVVSKRFHRRVREGNSRKRKDFRVNKT